MSCVYAYDAFGNEAEPSDTDPNPFRYCGEYYDTETGTYYLRARYYDPAVGRFATEDPARADLNCYTYCGNNPVMFVDPCGLEKVGLREYSESHGAVVEWNSDEKCVYVYYNGKELKIKSTNENNKNGRIYVDEEILYTFFEDRIKLPALHRHKVYR